MSNLYSSLKIKDVTLRNRIVMPPMCMYSAGDDGIATEWHKFHYWTRAQGGVGLIIQEATAVESRGRISSKDLGIWDDSQVPRLSEITKAITSEGAVPAIQLAHAGRKCIAPGEDVIAPSPLHFDPEDKDYKTPREMTEEDIQEVVNSFKAAAERADKAGYEILEIHGAHGYLINEFLSPLTNKRDDSYGGPMEKRVKMLRLVIKAIRTVWNADKPLMLRVTAEDYAEGGNNPEILSEMINLVKDEGLDIIHVSTGGVVPHVHIPVAPGFQIPAAETIRSRTGLPVIGGGVIRTYEEARDIVEGERADLVFMGRELLRNPYFPITTARKEGIDISYWPKPYERAK